eukprot:CAMPEP_0172724172 /NCGR_PEP_ID=MMETSP1074-20121228/85331_1 /TAXON_ID=2916 /ORGANISM="Ceratium fusus, Strain PA161109" /LENGTH=155 /DNA_ID=CAMNT_0013550559 /DNA_START=38 /DNA_END=505 /DNA_ORIENTATION=+
MTYIIHPEDADAGNVFCEDYNSFVEEQLVCMDSRNAQQKRFGMSRGNEQVPRLQLSSTRSSTCSMASASTTDTTPMSREGRVLGDMFVGTPQLGSVTAEERIGSLLPQEATTSSRLLTVVDDSIEDVSPLKQAAGARLSTDRPGRKTMHWMINQQ